MKLTPVYCSYYQAHVERELCWFVTATLRSYEHMVFDRTLDVESSLFEFFVSPDMEKQFLVIMSYFQEHQLVRNLVSVPNRLQQFSEQV